MANNRYVMVERQGFAIEDFNAFSAAAIAHVIDQVSEDISEDHGFKYTNTAGKRAARARMLGPRSLGGEIGVPIYSKGTPSMLYYALGSVTSAAVVNTGTADLMRHTIKPASSVPAFRMGVGKDIKEHQFVGCAVKSAKIDYSIDEPALATFDLLVRKELPPATLQTPVFPDYDTLERAFLGTEVTVDIGGTDVKYVRSLSIDISNGIVEDNFSFGGRELPDLRVQELEVTGSMSIVFNDIDRYNDVLNESKLDAKFVFQKGDPAADADARRVEIQIPNMSLDSANAPTDGNNEYVLDITFTAQAKVGTDNENIVIIIENTETGAQLAA